MPPRLHSPGTAAYTAKQGRFSLTSGERCSLCQRHRNSALGGMRISSLCPSALGPQKVGVGASPQKAFGCQWQAKRSACSTRGWVKSTSPVKRVTASQAHSALQGAVLWGYPAFPASSVEPSSIKTRTTAQIRPILAGRGRDAPPPSIGPHSGPQGQTGAKSPGTP